jgi:PKD repeat protein
MDVTLQANAVTVTILDPSFEGQTATEEIAQGWRVLRADASPDAEHIALSRTEAAGADAGMPTDGDKWAALDGLGTDGTDPVLTVENGIQADFILPTTATVLEFDYALLYSEPPAGLVVDAMTATVTDGVDTVEITSAAANVENGAYSGGSTRYEQIDGGTTRVTIVRTASLDVAAAFPSATANTVFTLTIRLTNAENSLRPPRAYVDAIRFTDTAPAFASSFSAPVTVVAGDTVDFLDETCVDPIGLGCEVPTSWRWDFDTRDSLFPPTSTGSALQDPSYEFTEGGLYDVTLLARNADQESLSMMQVDVIDAPASIPVIISVTKDSGDDFWVVQVRGDSSTSDDRDEIVEWNWDFGGLAFSTVQGSVAVPLVIEIPQGGPLQIRLTVTTASGLVAEGTVDVVLE